MRNERPYAFVDPKRKAACWNRYRNDARMRKTFVSDGIRVKGKYSGMEDRGETIVAARESKHREESIFYSDKHAAFGRTTG
jgi:hypothetical protein